MGVIANGHYALCGIGEHLPELTFGVIGMDRLEDLLAGETRSSMSCEPDYPVRLNGICSRCLMKNRCLGYCIAQNHYQSGSIWAPFWFCEQADVSGLFPDTRLAV